MEPVHLDNRPPVPNGMLTVLGLGPTMSTQDPSHAQSSLLAADPSFLAPEHALNQEKRARLLELRNRLTQKFLKAHGNDRAMIAHRPIYDQAFLDCMKAMDQDSLVDEL